MKVDVYFNLHKKVWSVRSRERANYGLVVEHSESVMLKDVTFVVNPAGRQKVLAQRKKNVHAFARGETHHPVLAEYIERTECKDSLVEVTYNPYKADHFVVKATGEKVTLAKRVYMTGKKVFAILEER